MDKANILIFVEDPGAANFVADLPSCLIPSQVHLFALGHAAKHLQNRNVSFSLLENDTKASALIDLVLPDAIVVGTCENKKTLAFDLIEEGKKRKIPTIAIVDMAVNAELRFRGLTENALTHVPEWIVTPDEATTKAFINLGFSKDHICQVGNPHYDFVLSRLHALQNTDKNALRIKLFPKLNENKISILFLSQPVSLLKEGLLHKDADYSLHGWKDSSKRTEIVLEELLTAIEPYRQDVYFGVRLHPKNSVDEFEQYKDHLDFLSVMEDPHEMLYAVDVIVGMSTMLLCEAALMERYAMSILPRIAEADWIPDEVSAVIPISYTSEQIKQNLHRILSALRNAEPVSKVAYEPGALKRISSFILEKARSQ